MRGDDRVRAGAALRCRPSPCARDPADPHVGGAAHARNSGFACGIEGRHADKLVCGPGCLSDARRNGRTVLALGRETGADAHRKRQTFAHIGAQIRQSTPNRMRLSARRPLVAAEFGARGITVRRALQPYDSLHANARRGGVDQPTQACATARSSPTRPGQRLSVTRTTALGRVRRSDDMRAPASPQSRPAASGRPARRPWPRRLQTCGTMEA